MFLVQEKFGLSSLPRIFRTHKREHSVLLSKRTFGKSSTLILGVILMILLGASFWLKGVAFITQLMQVSPLPLPSPSSQNIPPGPQLDTPAYEVVVRYDSVTDTLEVVRKGRRMIYGHLSYGDPDAAYQREYERWDFDLEENGVSTLKAPVWIDKTLLTQGEEIVLLFPVTNAPPPFKAGANEPTQPNVRSLQLYRGTKSFDMKDTNGNVTKSIEIK